MLIGFSIIFTIHFGGTPIFGNTQIISSFAIVEFVDLCSAAAIEISRLRQKLLQFAGSGDWWVGKKMEKDPKQSSKECFLNRFLGGNV